MKNPKLNTAEKALVELNYYPFKAMKAYCDRTGASLQEAKNEVDRFQENPEAYEAEENDQEQRRRDLERCAEQIYLEANILDILNSELRNKTNKTRNDVLAIQRNGGIFAEHIADILAPVFGVDLDEEDEDEKEEI